MSNGKQPSFMVFIRNSTKKEVKKEIVRQVKSGEINSNLDEDIIIECFDKDWVGIARGLLNIMKREDVKTNKCLIRIVMTCDTELIKKYIVRKGLDYNEDYYDVFFSLCEYGQTSAIKSIMTLMTIDPDLNDQGCIRIAASKHNYKLVDMLKQNLTVDKEGEQKVNSYLAISRVI